MTTTKLNATAPPFSSLPPPDLHEDETTIPASQEKNTRNDHDEAPDAVKPQNTFPPSPVERKIPTTSINSSSGHANILDTDHDHELHYKTQSAMRFVVKANKNLLSLLETESRRTPKAGNTRRMMNGSGQDMPAWHFPPGPHKEVHMDHRADYSHASHHHPNDKPAEFDNINHPRIRRPPRAPPGNDLELVTPEEIFAGHRLFMRLLGSTRKPVMLRQGYPHAQADFTSIAPVTTPMPVPDVRSGQSSPPAPTLTPTPICEKPMGKERSDFEALLRAGPNPAPKVEQVQLPTKVQEAAETLGVTQGAFLIALGKLNGKLESVDSKQQSVVQTGGSVDSNGDNDNTMEDGDRGPKSAAEKEKAPIPDSSSVPTTPTTMAELLAGHAGYTAGLRYQNASSMSRRVGFLAESRKIAEALGVTLDALLGALEKVKDDGAKARIPMAAAEKEKAAIAADAGF